MTEMLLPLAAASATPTAADALTAVEGENADDGRGGKCKARAVTLPEVGPDGNATEEEAFNGSDDTLLMGVRGLVPLPRGVDEPPPTLKGLDAATEPGGASGFKPPPPPPAAALMRLLPSTK